MEYRLNLVNIALLRRANRAHGALEVHKFRLTSHKEQLRKTDRKYREN